MTQPYPYVRYFPRNEPEVCRAGLLGAYGWLTRISTPRMVVEAIKLWQTIDALDGTIASGVSDAEANAALRGVTLASLDAVPMAGTVLAVVARRARKTIPETPQCALSWSTYGTPAGQPRLGDILCLLDNRGARASLYVGEDNLHYHCLGATEANKIGIERVAKIRLYSARRPLYEGVQFRPNGIRLFDDGALA